MPIVIYEGKCIEIICAGIPAASQSPTKLLRTACLSSEINHIELGNKRRVCGNKRRACGNKRRACGESAKSIFHRFQGWEIV